MIIFSTKWKKTLNLYWAKNNVPLLTKTLKVMGKWLRNSVETLHPKI
jgi:hypothetical protein